MKDISDVKLYTVSHVILLREKAGTHYEYDVYVPTMIIHEPHCEVHDCGNKCCKFDYTSCSHLRSYHRHVAVKNARDLAKRMSVNCDC